MLFKALREENEGLLLHQTEAQHNHTMIEQPALEINADVRMDDAAATTL